MCLWICYAATTKTSRAKPTRWCPSSPDTCALNEPPVKLWNGPALSPVPKPWPPRPKATRKTAWTPFTIGYHPLHLPVGDIILSQFHYLQADPQLKAVFPQTSPYYLQKR